MKICIISRTFYSQFCGVGDYTYWLAKTLSSKGYDVVVITSKSEDIKQAVDFKVLPVIENWGILHLFRLINVLRENLPNTVNLQYVPQMYGRAGIAPGIAMLPFFIKLIIRTKIVITFHELFISWNSRDFLLSAVQRVQSFLLTLGSDAVIVTTNLRKQSINLFLRWKKCFVIPVGSNIPIKIPNSREALPQSEVQRSVASKGPSNSVILSTFGSLHPGRDLLTVFNALSMIRKTNEQVILWIIGKVDTNSIRYHYFKTIIRSLGIEDSVFWISNISNQEVGEWLVHSDIYLSFGASGRSGTLMAALSFGLPIIAYDGRETEPVFKNNENMLLVPPKNPEILVKKINELIKNKEIRKRLGSKAMATFDKHFSWEVIGKEYEKVFSSIF